MTFKTFSNTVPDNINKVVEKCYRNIHIAFLFVTLKTTSKIENSPILYYPFTVKSNAITINIPASSTGPNSLSNEFVYGYITDASILASTYSSSLWIHLGLVLYIL